MSRQAVRLPAGPQTLLPVLNRVCKESPSHCVHPSRRERQDGGGVFGGEGGIRTRCFYREQQSRGCTTSPGDPALPPWLVSAASGRVRPCGTVWHSFRVTSPWGYLQSRFVREFTACDDVTWLFQRLLICWLKVRFLPGSPLLARLKRLALNSSAKRRRPSASPNMVDSFRAHQVIHSQALTSPLDSSNSRPTNRHPVCGLQIRFLQAHPHILNVINDFSVGVAVVPSRA